MSFNKKLLWGGLGWVMGGPIGAILGYAFASMNENQSSPRVGSGQQSQFHSSTKPADFVISILVLFAKVMKADGKLLKSELDYVKSFLKRNLSRQQSQVFIKMFQEILKQEYSTAEVCKQIQKSMDHPSRLELLHVL